MTYSYAWKSVFSPGKAFDFFSEPDPLPFNVKEQGFSQANAWWLSEISRLIYVKHTDETDIKCQTETRNSFLHTMGLEECWFHNGKHVQCAIIETLPGKHEKDFAILVFRGTQGKLSNWFFNFNALLSPWPAGGKVHKGFKLLLMEAWKEIEKQLDSIQKTVYYTGHSLGGALAVLASSLKKPEAVYTFGSPRVGDLDFVNSTQDIDIYRVFRSNDIVAYVPPFPGILHAGTPYNLTNHTTCNSRRSLFEAPLFLADHSPFNYTI